MRVVQHESGAALLARAGAFLTAAEAENNLQLGLAGQLPTPTSAREADSFLGTLESEGEVVGVGLQNQPMNPFTLSRMPTQALDALVHELAGSQRRLTLAVGVKETAEAFAERWAAATATGWRIEVPERIYQLTAVRSPRAVPGRLRQAVEADESLVLDWSRRFAADAGGIPLDDETLRRRTPERIRNGELWLWEDEDGSVVSIASASGRTPHGIRIGLVYTPPALRRRGYASACVAAVSQRMLDSGRRFCFLYTDLGNPTSNRIYQTIGYEPVCDVSLIRFEDGPASR
jgi:predicted GNAT family acetyltransferase